MNEIKLGLVEKVNIKDLLSRSDEISDWLLYNVLSNIYEFESMAREYAVLSVKIFNYYKLNKI